jgi:hypothetical protein
MGTQTSDPVTTLLSEAMDHESDRLTQTARDVLHAGVGLALLGVNSVQVRRREFERSMRGLRRQAASALDGTPLAGPLRPLVGQPRRTGGTGTGAGTAPRH